MKKEKTMLPFASYLSQELDPETSAKMEQILTQHPNATEWKSLLAEPDTKKQGILQTLAEKLFPKTVDYVTQNLTVEEHYLFEIALAHSPMLQEEVMFMKELSQDLDQEVTHLDKSKKEVTPTLAPKEILEPEQTPLGLFETIETIEPQESMEQELQSVLRPIAIEGELYASPTPEDPQAVQARLDSHELQKHLQFHVSHPNAEEQELLDLQDKELEACFRAILFIQSPHESREVELRYGLSTIGTSPQNTISLPGHEGVSAQHVQCWFNMQEATLVAWDIGSRNGTLVQQGHKDDTLTRISFTQAKFSNGKTLRNNEVLVLGQTRIKVCFKSIQNQYQDEPA